MYHQATLNERGQENERAAAGYPEAKAKGSASKSLSARFSRISNLRFQISSFKFQISSFRTPISRSNSRGFTLIELMVVLTVLLILATMSMPIFHLAIVHAREAVLKDDLFTLRKLIDEYTLDKQHPPTTLDELVEAGYLRGGIPVDPFTGSNDTWHTDVEDVPLNPNQSASGIVDVHSGSEETGLDGTAYSSW
jgi:general secretion pathway protein G